MTEKQTQREKEKEERRRERLEKEKARSEKMLEFERKYASFGVICGIDEAGRGPIAGPVTAGAVILPKDHMILYLNDSKKLTPKKREELYTVIQEEAVSFGIGMTDARRIDEIGILGATYEAMREAFSKLSPVPGLSLNDAVTIPELGARQVPIIKGDAKSASIAAASILAKVYRDRLMLKYDELYPEYGFASHKGYGTAQHKEALLKYGLCPIHRVSFARTFLSK